MAEQRGLIIVMTDPPEEKEQEWNEWYSTRHVPARLEIPGFLFARRFFP